MRTGSETSFSSEVKISEALQFFDPIAEEL